MDVLRLVLRDKRATKELDDLCLKKPNRVIS